MPPAANTLRATSAMPPCTRCTLARPPAASASSCPQGKLPFFRLAGALWQGQGLGCGQAFPSWLQGTKKEEKPARQCLGAQAGMQLCFAALPRPSQRSSKLSAAAELRAGWSCAGSACAPTGAFALARVHLCVCLHACLCVRLRWLEAPSLPLPALRPCAQGSHARLFHRAPSPLRFCLASWQAWEGLGR